MSCFPCWTTLSRCALRPGHKRALIVGLLALFAAGCGEKPPESFTPAPASFFSIKRAGDTLWNPVVGDWNGDGKPDLIGAGPMPGRIISLLAMFGAGDGSFSSSPTGLGAENWANIATADLNHDGKSDVVIEGGGHGLELPFLVSALSDGSTFVVVKETAAVHFGDQSAIVAADIDGDHLPELVAYPKGTTPLVQKGDGTGTFIYPDSGGATSGGVRALSADLNGDGTADLVAAIDENSLQLAAGGATVTLDAVPNGAAIADFNGDGVPDVALLQNPPAGSDSEVRVLLGRGHFSLDPPIATKTGLGTMARELVTGDMNGDGRADLALLVPDVATTALLLGKGDGTFEAARMYEGVAATSLAAGDWNRDGMTDLVIPGDSLMSLMADGHGGLAAARKYRLDHDGQYILSADLNHDGKQDLVLAGQDFITRLVSVSTLVNQGAENFVTMPLLTLPAPRTLTGVAVGDWNEDGKPDAVVGSVSDDTMTGAMHVLLGKGDGTFAPPSLVPLPVLPVGITAADMNKDGHLDLISANEWAGEVAISLGNGDGTFAAPTSYPAGSLPVSPRLVDFDNDGNLDVVVQRQSDSTGHSAGLTVLLGNGDGTLQAPHAGDLFDGYSSLTFSSYALSDWDRDGKIDILLCGSATGMAAGTVGGLVLWKGDGHGSFSLGPLSPTGGTCPILSGDVNGDGAADLVGTLENERLVWLSQGDGTFTAPTTFHTAAGANGGMLLDTDGDGKLDIVDLSWNSVVVHRNATP